MRLETLEAANAIKNKLDGFHFCIEQLDAVLGFSAEDYEEIRNIDTVAQVFRELLQIDLSLFDDEIKKLQASCRYHYAKQLTNLQTLTDETANP